MSVREKVQRSGRRMGQVKGGSLPNLSQPRAPETSQLSIMPASPALDEVLAANKAYQASGQHRPNLKLGVSRRLVVLTCMDSR